ncbi:MAG: methyltransferase domain-containing protein [Acidobacteria bacterium]|nr:methyltransferase domain-containing protein [Acidobacteriota bacterium]
MTRPADLIPYLHLLQCPQCGSGLTPSESSLCCQRCAHDFSIRDGIPLLFCSPQGSTRIDQVTEIVKSFYEEHPFPDYEGIESLSTLIERARQGVFARLLDEQIPFGSRVLDCGCGTGQLSNFLAIAHRTVFGTDICLNSLALANQFKRENRLERVHFLQMNLFAPVFPTATFDCIICNGVLHHTADSARGLASLASLLKPGGYLIVGLYHRTGRIPNDVRRLLFRVGSESWGFLDPQLRRNPSMRKKKAWFFDQYRHPHERKHTLGEVVSWLESNSLNLIKVIPKPDLLSNFKTDEPLFQSDEGPGFSRGRIADVVIALRAYREGGFFTVIAQKQP